MGPTLMEPRLIKVWAAGPCKKIAEWQLEGDVKEGQMEERESGCEVVEWLKSEGMSLKKWRSDN